MNKSTVGILLFVMTVLGAMGGGVIYFGKNAQTQKDTENAIAQAGLQPSQEQEQKQETQKVPSIQQELNELSAKMVAQLRAEDRLNLNMVAQLRSYQEMMRQIEEYAQNIERNLGIIEEISKDEFQEDVKLQAALFSGKKSSLVAKHLEEFRASRVGAILAKMKQKEASAVLDVWASHDDPKVSAFYREVMAAYLNNRRRDTNPELFDQLTAEVHKKSTQS